MKICTVDVAKNAVVEGSDVRGMPSVLNELRDVQEKTGALKKILEGGAPLMIAQNHCHTDKHDDRSARDERWHVNRHTNTWRHCKNDTNADGDINGKKSIV